MGRFSFILFILFSISGFAYSNCLEHFEVSKSDERDKPTVEEAKTLYQLLEVSKTASNEEIIAAYRKKVLLYHPDKYQGQSAEVIKEMTEKFQAIQMARDILTDPVRRDIYDQTGSTLKYGHQNSADINEEFWKNIKAMYYHFSFKAYEGNLFANHYYAITRRDMLQNIVNNYLNVPGLEKFLIEIYNDLKSYPEVSYVILFVSAQVPQFEKLFLLTSPNYFFQAENIQNILRPVYIKTLINNEQLWNIFVNVKKANNSLLVKSGYYKLLTELASQSDYYKNIFIKELEGISSDSFIFDRSFLLKSIIFPALILRQDSPMVMHLFDQQIQYLTDNQLGEYLPYVPAEIEFEEFVRFSSALRNLKKRVFDQSCIYYEKQKEDLELVLRLQNKKLVKNILEELIAVRYPTSKFKVLQDRAKSYLKEL